MVADRDNNICHVQNPDLRTQFVKFIDQKTTAQNVTKRRLKYNFLYMQLLNDFQYQAPKLTGRKAKEVCISYDSTFVK